MSDGQTHHQSHPCNTSAAELAEFKVNLSAFVKLHQQKHILHCLNKSNTDKRNVLNMNMFPPLSLAESKDLGTLKVSLQLTIILTIYNHHMWVGYFLKKTTTTSQTSTILTDFCLPVKYTCFKHYIFLRQLRKNNKRAAPPARLSLLHIKYRLSLTTDCQYQMLHLSRAQPV